MTYRDNNPGHCLQNALSETGIDAEVGEWPLVEYAAQVIRDKGVVVVDEGDFIWKRGERCIVVYGDEIDDDIVLAHAVVTNDASEYLDKDIWMIVFVERSTNG